MPDFSTASDEELVLRAVDGDLSAFDEIVGRHQSMIARCLFRFCPHRSDLEDLTQDTFIKAFRKLNSWQATAPFENWLRKIAYNTGYDHFRRNRRNPASVAGQIPEENESLLDRLSEPERARHDLEMLEQAQTALSLLEVDERMIMTLQYLEDRPLAEIAEQMGWSLSKTKVKSFRARKKLRRILVSYGITEETTTPFMG